MTEALGAVFPDTTLQTCIVRLIRNSLNYAARDKRRELAKALKPIYQAITADAAEQALDAFETGPWGKQYPTVVDAWRWAWDRVIPFFAFPPATRKVITRPTPSRASTLSHEKSSILVLFPDRRCGNQTDLAWAARYHCILGLCGP